MPRYAVTGKCDDFLALIAEAERTPGLPWKPPWLRSLCLPFHLAGRALEGAARLSPAPAFFAFQDFVLGRVAGACGGLPFDEEGLRRAERLYSEWAERGKTPPVPSGFQAPPGTGERRTAAPALLCLMSHPLVNETETGLIVEMGRHALRALRRLRGPWSRPSLVLGVDCFALDTLGIASEETYASFMGHYHAGLDRQAHLRGLLGSRLMSKTAWTSGAWRIAGTLLSGGELAVALAGGVPVTSRILYAARECLRRLCRERPAGVSPREALAKLGADEGFRGFLDSGLAQGGLRKSAWRLMELWMTALLTVPQAYERAGRGEMAEPARAAFCACAAALGYAPEAVRARLSELEDEFARATPYRERFFRLLASRVLAKGRPLFLLPLRHRTDPLRLEFLEPLLLTPEPPRDFVRRNFP
jgi:hypothetical protein